MLKPTLDKLFAGQWKKGAVPQLWDGRTGERIAAQLDRLLDSHARPQHPEPRLDSQPTRP
jgi:hypothetical protein